MRRIFAFIPALSAADQPDRDALDCEALPWIDHDRLEIGILRHEQHFTPAPFQPFDRHFLAKSRDDDLARAGVRRPVHGEQVAIDDAGIAHRRTVYPQEVIGPRREEPGVDPVARLDVLDGEDRAARGHPTDQGQRALHRQPGDVPEAQAPRCAGQELERAFPGECLQVVLRRAGGRKAQTHGDLGPRGRHARSFQMATDPVEDLLLPGRQLRRAFRQVGRDSPEVGEGAA